MRVVLRLLVAAFLVSSARAQQPTPTAAYVFTGGAWTPATTTATQGAVSSTPSLLAGLYYYNSTLKKWVPYDGGGGGATFPAAGVAVSTGTGWTTPIDPANIPRLDASNNFTNSTSATQQFFRTFATPFITATDAYLFVNSQLIVNAQSIFGAQNATTPHTTIQPGGALDSPAITVAGSPVCTVANPCPAAAGAAGSIPILSKADAVKATTHCQKGATWVDGDYLVICVARNTPKRVRLEAFDTAATSGSVR